MPRGILLGRAYVDHGDGARLGALLELVAGDRLAAVVAEIGQPGGFDVGQMGLRQLA
jgi:hypothetical protein